jgi:uncharacterized YigZ family protein
MDHYRTIAAPAEASLRVQRSEFRAFARPLPREEDFPGHLEALQKEHFDATHHCWAYRLWVNEDGRARSSDAGEPSGSAGRPILSAIEASGLADLSVIVARWYGGVKLGTGGLGRAYREAARQALASAPVRDIYLYSRFEIEVPYASISEIYRLIDPPHVLLAEERFEERTTFTIDVRRGRAEAFAGVLAERRLPFRRV